MLMAIARTPDHPFCLSAVRTLAAMPASPEANQSLRQLLNVDNNAVRIEAYRSLVRNRDPRVFTQVVQEKYVLDLVPSSGTPLVFATSRGLPRIAVFGTRQTLVTPVTFSSLDSRLTITADEPGGTVTLYYRSEASAGDRTTGIVRQQSRADLPDLLARLGGEAAEDERRLDFSYADVVSLLQAMHQAGKLTGAALDGTAVPITLVIEEGDDVGADNADMISAPRIPETGRKQNDGDDASVPRIPDAAAPATPPAAEPQQPGRAN